MVPINSGLANKLLGTLYMLECVASAYDNYHKDKHQPTIHTTIIEARKQWQIIFTDLLIQHLSNHLRRAKRGSNKICLFLNYYTYICCHLLGFYNGNIQTKIKQKTLGIIYLIMLECLRALNLLWLHWTQNYLKESQWICCKFLLSSNMRFLKNRAGITILI